MLGLLVQTFSQSQLNTVSIVVRKGADQNCAMHCHSAILHCSAVCGVGEQWKMRPRGSCSAAVELQCCSVAEPQCAAALQSRTVAVLQSCGKEGSTGAHCGKAECKSIQWQFNLMQWQYKAIQLQWRKVQMKKKTISQECKRCKKCKRCKEWWSPLRWCATSSWPCFQFVQKYKNTKIQKYKKNSVHFYTL